ncbi:MAG: hypothetical protein M1816_002250 [Peltula sp. TS41687]|nr:MAG: hypothetical protein M1816_002250 [Peltula sp. TS41687]
MSKHNPPDSVVDQPGLRPTIWRQAGRPVGPEDDILEFHGKVLPPGSAPKDSTFDPNADDGPSQAANSDVAEDAQTSAMDTIGGATSADVHRGYGHPGQGQTSTELRHDGQHGRKSEPLGLAGVTSSTATNQAADPRIDQTQRALDKDEAQPGRGDKGAEAAEDIAPESA